MLVRAVFNTCAIAPILFSLLQFQVAVDHSGGVVWFTGPHIGSRHDSRLFEQNAPPQSRGEQWLADLAYVKMHRLGRCICPVKRKPGRVLTENQQAFNTLHSWYRSTVEHTIGYIKRFNIIGGLYRGKVWRDCSFLYHACVVIMNCVSLHVSENPLRIHRYFDPDPDDEDDDNGDDGNAVDDAGDPDALPMGHEEKVDERNNADADMELDAVDTGFEFDDFSPNDKVHFFDGWVWRNGKVRYLAKRTKTLSIDCNEGGIIYEVQPHHVEPIY